MPAPTRLFGTDGVRGTANADLTPELAMSVAAAAVQVFGAEARRTTGRPAVPTAVVGRDPRASGEMLDAAVVAGLASAGAWVIRVGVLPTPAVAMLTGDLDADLGVMISASHNPMPDNGIKLFAAGGHKLPDELEDAIERAIRAGADWQRPTGAGIGRVTELPDGAQRYADRLVASAPHRLDGLRVVVDCANGAAAAVAPEVYRRGGAEVVAIHAEPDGLNINDGCGSTHLAPLAAAVTAHRADLGLAFDGDADRLLAVDAAGQVVDGDQILAVLALAMREAGTLTRNTVVATVMSNQGLRLALAAAGITLVEVKVGDRYVLAELRASGLALGGEQSGHVVLPAYATTGDGVLTGLHVMARMAATGRSLAELASVVTRLPQVLVNVPVADKQAVAARSAVTDAVAAAQARLGETGRVLLRPSGTESLVRVMVEAPTAELAQATADQLAAVIRAAEPAG